MSKYQEIQRARKMEITFISDRKGGMDATAPNERFWFGLFFLVILQYEYN